MEELDKLRNQIDQIDEQIITLLQKRFDVVKHIGKIKFEKNLSIIDKKRKNKILKLKTQKAKEEGLSENFIKNLFSLIHEESVRTQDLSFRANEMSRGI